MPNGYDGLYSEVKFLFHFLDYSEALVRAEEKMFSHLGELRVNSPLLPRMMTVLEETEAISKFLQEKFCSDVRQKIVEHNRDMEEAFSVGAAEAMKKEGIPDAEIATRVKGSIERTMIDFESMDAKFSSIVNALSELKDKVRAFNDYTKESG